MRQKSARAALSKSVRSTSSCTRRARFANSKVVRSSAAPSSPTRPPKSRAPSERVRATQAIPASAEGSRAAASLTRPPGTPASAASQK